MLNKSKQEFLIATPQRMYQKLGRTGRGRKKYHAAIKQKSSADASISHSEKSSADAYTCILECAAKNCSATS